MSFSMWNFSESRFIEWYGKRDFQHNKLVSLSLRTFPFSEFLVLYKKCIQNNTFNVKIISLIWKYIIYVRLMWLLYFTWCVHVCVLGHFSCVWLFVTLWTVVCQAPLSMGFSRQEYWSGLPCSPPRDLPYPGIELVSLISPALAGRFFTTSTTCITSLYHGIWFTNILFMFLHLCPREKLAYNFTYSKCSS